MFGKRTCPRCQRDLPFDVFGTQSYCRDCWRIYNKGRQAARRAKLKRLAEAARQLALIQLLPEEARQERLGALRVEYPELWENESPSGS